MTIKMVRQVREMGNLIHMLAKQDTPMNVRRTVLGRVPARLRMRVINTRSIFVLLRADEIVKPPMSNIIVGENIMEKTYLKQMLVAKIQRRFLEKRASLPQAGSSGHHRCHE